MSFLRTLFGPIWGNFYKSIELSRGSAWGREDDEGWRRTKERLDTVNR